MENILFFLLIFSFNAEKTLADLDPDPDLVCSGPPPTSPQFGTWSCNSSDSCQLSCAAGYIPHTSAPVKCLHGVWQTNTNSSHFCEPTVLFISGGMGALQDPELITQTSNDVEAPCDTPPSLTQKWFGHTSFYYNLKKQIYLCGGGITDSTCTSLNATTMSWSDHALQFSIGAGVTSVKDEAEKKVIFIGGRSANGNYPTPTSVSLPMSSSPALTPVPNLSYRGWYPCVTLLHNSSFLIIGGNYDSTILSDVTRYSLLDLTNTTLASMSVPRYQHACATLNINSTEFIVVAGGISGLDPIAASEILDTRLNKWSPMEPLQEKKYGFRMMITKAGILVLGGFGDDGSLLDSIERWDSTNGSWVTTERKLKKSRFLFGATEIPASFFQCKLDIKPGCPVPATKEKGFWTCDDEMSTCWLTCEAGELTSNGTIKCQTGEWQHINQINCSGTGAMPPSNFSSIPDYKRELAGAEIEIQCIPPDSSSLILTWFKNGVAYNPGDDPNIEISKPTQSGGRSHLRILKARLEDSANFTCVAKNSAGLQKESTISEIIIYELEKVEQIKCNLETLIAPLDDGKESNVFTEAHEDQAFLNFVIDFSKSHVIDLNQIEGLKINEIVLIEQTVPTKYTTCDKIGKNCSISIPVLITSEQIEIEVFLNELQKCEKELMAIENILKDYDDWRKYSSWTEWSVCSVECGEGNETRNRDCRLGRREKFCNPKYKDKLVQERKCTGNKTECGNYRKWGDWGPCSIPCIKTKNQPGKKNRTRVCDIESECYEGGKIEIKNCFGEPDFQFCPLDCSMETSHKRSHVTKTRYDLTVEIKKPQDKEHPAKKQNLLLRKSGSNIEDAEVRWEISDAKTCEESRPSNSDIIDYNCSLDEENNCVCTFHALKMRTPYSLTRIIYETTSSNSDILDPRYCPEKLDEEYHWQCDNKETILFSQLCDANDDCTDASDEGDALCEGDTLLLLNIGLPLAILLIVNIILVCILIKYSLEFKTHHKDQFSPSTVGKAFFEKVYGNSKKERDARKIIRDMGAKDIEQIIKMSSTMEFYLHKKVLKLVSKEFGKKKLLQFLYSSVENRSKLKLAFDIVQPGVTDKLTQFIKLKIPVSRMAILTHVSDVTAAASFTITPFRDFFKDCSLITILYYFSNEILQNDFARIGYLRLDHIVHLLIGILVLTILFRTWVEIVKFPDQVVDMNKYLKVLILLPGFYPTLHAAICISLSWNIQSSKRKLAKLSQDPWNENTWQAKLEEIQRIYSLDEKMSLMKDEARFSQGCENVLETFFQAIITTILVLRGKLFNFFQSTITKRIPFVFPLIIIYSFLTLVLKARSYKSGFKQGCISLGGIVQTLALCCSILQKSMLYILASYQYTFIAVIVLGLVTCVIFALNSRHNKMFASSKLVDRVAYSLISAMIPITFTDRKMVKTSEEEAENPEYHIAYGRKRTLSQGFSIHSIHFLESVLLVVIIAVQEYVDKQYASSITGFLNTNGLRLGVPLPVVLFLLSICFHLMAGLLNFAYYRVTHPWKAITLTYPILKYVGICPVISTYDEDFNFEVQDEEMSEPLQLKTRAKGVAGPWM